MSRPDRSSRNLTLRRRVLLGVWLLSGCVILARAAKMQLLDAATWRDMAADQQRMTAAIPAARGSILDRDGVPLAISRETFIVSVDPQQVLDVAGVQTILGETLGLSREWQRKATDTEREWVQLPGRYSPVEREALKDVPGIYVARELQRDYPHGELARGILGRVFEGVGRGGIEQGFEELLAGVPGRQVVARDGNMNPIPGQVYEISQPVAGRDVMLTIDLDLQEIAHQALSEAVERTGARGGDLIVADPKTGEILAMVSMTEGRYDALSAVNTPYEPGSTLKPITIAGVLKHGRGLLSDTVDAEMGRWPINGRILTDTHDEGLISVGDALRVSSNIGVAKAALNLSAQEQYENLRDFGFGVETGIPLPGEVNGTLRRPDLWSGQSPQSLAIGYEIAVTPMQMTMAYSALANGGYLMEPRLIRSIEQTTGEMDSVAPRVIRQVVDAGVAGQIGQVLVEVVEDGTGSNAQLETFQVAGKTGTSRAYGVGGYERGRYFSSFAGYFPAENPQLVVFVKFDLDSDVYYGGATAAPVIRATMEGALAIQHTPLDRKALISSQAAMAPDATAGASTPNRFAALPAPVSAAPSPTAFISAPGETRVPDVKGMPIRDAVRLLHERGLRVIWAGGDIIEVFPAPGTLVMPGDTIRLRARRGAR